MFQLWQIQRWIQSKFLDTAAAVKAWRDAAGDPNGLKCLRRVSDHVRSTLKNGNIVTPLARFKLLDKKHWHPKIKSVFLQISLLLRVSGFRNPDHNICSGIITRCELYAAVACAEALVSEREDDN